MNKIYMKVDPKDLWKFTLDDDGNRVDLDREKGVYKEALVEIMLAQMKILFGIEEGVRRHKQLKLNRLKNDCKDRR